MTLNDAEIKELLHSPEALTVLIDWNDQQESEADAADMPKEAAFYRERRKAFQSMRMESETKRAERIEK
jgi:hypothetical protein